MQKLCKFVVLVMVQPMQKLLTLMCLNILLRTVETPQIYSPCNGSANKKSSHTNVLKYFIESCKNSANL